MKKNMLIATVAAMILALAIAVPTVSGNGVLPPDGDGCTHFSRVVYEQGLPALNPASEPTYIVACGGSNGSHDPMPPFTKVCEQGLPCTASFSR